MSAVRLEAFGITPRAVQMQFIDALHQAEHYVNRVSFVHADTGIGKSLGMLSTALDWMDAGYRVIIATHTHKLIRQLALAELPLIAPDVTPGIYYGLSSYPSADRIHYLLAVESFDTQSTAYLEMLSQYVGAIDDFIDEYGPLPDGVNENQVNCLYGHDNEDIVIERKLALSKQLVFTTHSALINDGLYNRGLFDLNDKTALIIDEGDAFIDNVEGARFQILSIREVVDFLQEHAGKKALDPLRELVSSIHQSLADNPLSHHAELARRFLDTVRGVSVGKAKWQDEFRRRFQSFLRYIPEVSLIRSKVKRVPQLVISQPYVNRRIGEYLCGAHHAVLVSGTLSVRNDIDGLDWAISSLRLNESVGLKAQFSPEKFGELTFALAAADENYPDVYVGNGELSQRWLKRVASDIKLLSDKDDVVVLTGSHKESEAIEQVLSQIGFSRLISRHQAGSSINEAAAPFLRSGGVFITAAGHTGLNLVTQSGELAFKSLVITRIGMAPKDDDKARFAARMQAEMSGQKDIEQLKASYLRREYSRNVVRSIRRIKQAIGRAIRSETHKAHIVICDPRFPLYENRDNRLSMLREAIPLRFKATYQSASTQCKKNREVLF
jgi:ATP-dependent DNA helicase DinG